MSAVLPACGGLAEVVPSDSVPLPVEIEVDTETDTDLPTTSDPVCEAVVLGVSPADGTAAVTVESEIVATFSLPAVAPTIVLDPAVSGVLTIADDGLSATYTPDAPLARASTYTARAAVCDSSTQSRFVTVGAPVTVDLALRTWDVDLGDRSDLAWVAPASGPSIFGLLDTPHLLVMAESVEGDTIHFILAVGTDDRGAAAQYPCTIAVAAPPGDFSGDPGFVAGPVYAIVVLGGAALPLWDLVLSGEVASDGTALLNLVVTGLLDVAPLAEVLGEDACALAARFGDSCVPCPTGVTSCLAVEAHDARAAYLPGFTIDPYLTPDDSCD